MLAITKSGMLWVARLSRQDLGSHSSRIAYRSTRSTTVGIPTPGSSRSAVVFIAPAYRRCSHSWSVSDSCAHERAMHFDAAPWAIIARRQWVRWLSD